jgi:hypothetical protein
MTDAFELAGIPTDRVIQLLTQDVGTVAMAVAEDGTDLAGVVARQDGRWQTPAAFVEAALEDLERVAVELLPIWLPAAAGDVAAIRMAATAHAKRANYAPALLMDLAVLAMTGRRDTTQAGQPFRTRAVQLARLVAEGFRRSRPVLLVPLAANLTAPEQEAIASGAGWLTQNAKMAVWLVGPLPASGDSVPLLRLSTALPRRAPVGKPHPPSELQAALEGALTAESWAVGRQWNQIYQSGPLSAPVRLDLLWAHERCIVELDGPEHCHPVHFEADRQRDVQLQLDGYAVLRFTNARVLHDVGAVAHEIGTCIRDRRRDTANGSTPWPATRTQS